MATVDMNFVQIYGPPFNPSFRWKKHSGASYTDSRTVRAISSLIKAAPHNELDQKLESYDQFGPGIVAALDKRDDIGSQFETSRDGAVRAQDIAGSNHDPTNSNDESEDDFLPTIEELLRTTLPTDASTAEPFKPQHAIRHPDKPALDATGMPIKQTRSRLGGYRDDNRGSRDRPVVIDDDEPDSTDDEDEDEAEATRGGVDRSSAERDANLYSAFLTQETDPELSTPIVPSGPERWYDVEAGCYVYEEPPPDLEPEEQQGSAVSTPAPYHHYSSHHSARPSHHQIGQHDNDTNTQHTSEQPATQSTLELLREGDDGWSDDQLAEFEKEVELVLEDQEKSLSATAPSSPPPHRRSTEPLQNQIDGHDQGESTRTRPEEPRDASPVETPDESEEAAAAQQGVEGVGEKLGEEQQQQQQEEDGVGVVEGIETQGEQQQHEEEEELDELAMEEPQEEEELDELAMEEPQEEEEDDADNPEDEDYSCDTGDEDDENLRPTKLRKLPLGRIDEGLEEPRNPSAKLGVRQPRRLTSPSSMQIEIDDIQSQTVHPRFIDNKRHDILRSPRSPSATAESVPAAEYQEWPVHGFLKQTRIGKETTFNLEFHLAYLLEDLRQSAPFEALGSSLGIKTSAQPRISHSAIAHSKTRQVISRRPIKRSQWTAEEDATLVRMKEDNCSWEEISAALPFRSPGAIQVHYYTNFSSGTRSRKHRRS